MDLYNGSSPPTSATIRQVTGQFVARAHLTPRQRVRLAAELANGTVQIVPLTIKQAAALARVSMLDVSKARRRDGKHNGRHSPGEALAEQIRRTPASDRLVAARIIGPAEIWDTMMDPVARKSGRPAKGLYDAARRGGGKQTRRTQ
jgi:hypothetical protein